MGAVDTIEERGVCVAELSCCDILDCTEYVDSPVLLRLRALMIPLPGTDNVDCPVASKDSVALRDASDNTLSRSGDC